MFCRYFHEIAAGGRRGAAETRLNPAAQRATLAVHERRPGVRPAAVARGAAIKIVATVVGRRGRGRLPAELRR